MVVDRSASMMCRLGQRGTSNVFARRASLLEQQKWQRKTRNFGKKQGGLLDRKACEYLSNRWKNKGFVVVITIRSNTQIHLFRIGVGLEGFSNTKNWIRRTLRDFGPGRNASEAKETVGEANAGLDATGEH